MRKISFDLNETTYRKLEKLAVSANTGIADVISSLFAREVATPKQGLVYRKPCELPFCREVATPICGLGASVKAAENKQAGVAARGTTREESK